MNLALLLLAELVVIWAIAEVCIRVPAKWLAPAWTLLALGLLPRFLQQRAEWAWVPIFSAKLVAVLAGTIVLFACIAWVRARWVLKGFTWFVLVGNILLMVAGDVREGRWLSATAGVLLVASIEHWDSPRIDEHHGLPVARVDLSWAWIVAYAVWDVCMLYGYQQAYPLGMHLPLLVLSLVLPWLWGRELWVQARLVTFGAHMLLYGACYGFAREHLDTSSWYLPRVHTGLSVLALAVCALAFVLRLASGRRRRKALGEAAEQASAGRL